MLLKKIIVDFFGRHKVLQQRILGQSPFPNPFQEVLYCWIEVVLLIRHRLTRVLKTGLVVERPLDLMMALGSANIEYLEVGAGPWIRLGKFAVAIKWNARTANHQVN